MSEQGRQMRYTEAELSLIKHTFGSDEVLKVLRKTFLPELDPDAPIGNQIDLWMTVKVDDLTAEQAVVNIKARNSLIMHVEQQLVQLKLLAEMHNETPEDAIMKLKKNSSN
jgi:hypothetical protein